MRMSMFYSEYDNSDLHHFVDHSDDNGEHENEEPKDEEVPDQPKVAVVFDPRFKMQIVEYFYGEIYGSNALPYIQRVHNSLDDLFFSYGGRINSSSNEVGTSIRATHFGKDSLSATTVAYEAAFSVGGRVLDESRACLLPDVVEALIVAADLID
ncbi:hypothetical protein RD792_005407 [Penstemon davidsonii]|uniref:Uncharacterized protein n=1 Tax=Penstemon davidsonii TaxID=160366 RepID=A0ABR0DKU6_9LAMI|nr:hypothetical protein RD792_005407 [Penstemon davidsonii]